ncbi:unnamed protein product, partial [Didymodactylos carnosus]
MFTIRGQWNPAASMGEARLYHTATLLNSGKVLVTGGVNVSFNTLASCEIYDASMNQWNSATSMATARYDHTAN